MTKYNLETTASFRKGYRRMQKRGYDMRLLDAVLQELLAGKTLDAKYRDHPLKGKHRENRECHILDDWVLEYRIVKDRLILIAVMTGTHQDTFE